MTLTAAVPHLEVPPPMRAGVPVVPHWTSPRPALDRRLDRGAEAVLTLVTAPTGFGKTHGVASWAAGPTSPDAVAWVNLARGGGDPDRVWKRLRDALLRTGSQDLPAAPAGDRRTSARRRALVELGEALRDGTPTTVVLDGFPTGPPGRLGTELETLLEHAGRCLRVVLLARAEPAMDLHRLASSGEVVRIGESELTMDADDVADCLRLADAPADPATVQAVTRRTGGWACGVRRAAVSLASGVSVTAALAESDRALEDYLAFEVMSGMTVAHRRLLAWTSPLEVVPAELMRCVLGADGRRALGDELAASGLVGWAPDGSLLRHPLLRAAARNRLPLELPDDAQSWGAHREVVQWHVDHGATADALTLCLSARDWESAAAVLVRSHAVPRLVAGVADEVERRTVELPEIQAAEPLLHAAVVLARRDPWAAEVAVAAGAGEDETDEARRLAAVFLHLGLARVSGRAPADSELAARARHVLAWASFADRAALAEVGACLDALVGAVETADGRLDSATAALTRGAERADLPADHPAVLDCAGQLAMLEAHLGNLTQAARRAEAVLDRADGEPLVGVGYAHVALAWVHAERGQVAEAEARLQLAAEPSLPSADPWLATARRLVRARVLILAGQPDEALRVAPSQTDWLTGMATVVRAEASLAAGEPQQALAAVTLGLPSGSAERAVLSATACRDIGDARGAAAAIASAADDLPRAPRATELQGWLVQARLAFDRGEVDRAAPLVGRVLRAASAEDLRRPLLADADWLRRWLDRDGSAPREHRLFVQSLLEPDAAQPRTRPTWAAPDRTVLEPLTDRETQVLVLLAQMCSTDEIAAELFVSANTVKTHLKGIFRKYAVNRRVDAVRRGRELGVC